MAPFWSRKVRLDVAVKTLQNEARVQMASFDSKISDILRQYAQINKKLNEIEAKL